MNRQLLSFIQLGSAILIMSTSGTLGRYIDGSPTIITWFRCIIATIALFIILKVMGISLRIERKSQFWLLFGGAVLMGMHWISYFYALQLSNVAIGMLSLFTYPVITALLEPIILKTPLQKMSVGLGIIAFIGVAFLAPELSISNDYTLGIIVGILSALCYSIRNILLKKRIGAQSGVAMMFYQTLFLSFLLLPFLFFFEFDSSNLLAGWEAIVLLGLLTTALGHTLFVLSFKHFNISTVSVISSLTPLIGTLLGYMVLDEVPTGRTFLGGTLIFVAVVAESVRSVRSLRGSSS